MELLLSTCQLFFCLVEHEQSAWIKIDGLASFFIVSRARLVVFLRIWLFSHRIIVIVRLIRLCVVILIADLIALVIKINCIIRRVVFIVRTIRRAVTIGRFVVLSLFFIRSISFVGLSFAIWHERVGVNSIEDKEAYVVLALICTIA